MHFYFSDPLTCSTIKNLHVTNLIPNLNNSDTRVLLVLNLAVAISLVVLFSAALLKLNIWNLQMCFSFWVQFYHCRSRCHSNFLSTHFQTHHFHWCHYKEAALDWAHTTDHVLVLPLPFPCSRPLPLISAQDQQPFKWTMPRTFKREMKNMAMSVWMARTVPVFSAALKIAEQEPGDMEGYTSGSPKWTPMPGSSSPRPSACLIWFTGSPTFTCEKV